MKYQDSFSISMIDFMFVLLLGFAALMALLILLPKKPGDSVPMEAKYLIIMEWQDTSKDDIDLWVKHSPSNSIVYYGNTRGYLMHLNRDDTGATLLDDVVTVDGVKHSDDKNIEVVKIRSALEGEYVINIHSYRQKDENPSQVQVRIYSVLPFLVLLETQHTLTRTGQEDYVGTIRINEEGQLDEVVQEPELFVNKHRRNLFFGDSVGNAN